MKDNRCSFLEKKPLPASKHEPTQVFKRHQKAEWKDGTSNHIHLYQVLTLSEPLLSHVQNEDKCRTVSTEKQLIP